MSAAIAPNPNDPQAPLGMPARPWWIGYIRQLHLDIPLAVESGGTGKNTPLDASDIAETSALKIMTTGERTKLTGIAENAEVNAVDSVAGRTGDVTLDADDVAPTTSKLWMSDTQSAKLAGIAEGANNYTHPATHPQSMIDGLATSLASFQKRSSLSAGGSSTINPAAVNTCYNFTGAGTLVLPNVSTVTEGDYVDVFCQSTTATVTISSPENKLVSRMGVGTGSITLSGLGNSLRLIRINLYWFVLFDATPEADKRISRWVYTFHSLGGSITGEAWKIHGFGATGTITIPLASTVTAGTQIAGMVVAGGATVTITRSGSDQFVTPTGLATSYTLEGNGSSVVLVRVTASAWAVLGAPDSLINAKAAGALLTEGTPSGPTATGTKGMARFDADYFYVCTATNTWVRFAKDGSWT